MNTKNNPITESCFDKSSITDGFLVRIFTLTDAAGGDDGNGDDNPPAPKLPFNNIQIDGFGKTDNDGQGGQGDGNNDGQGDDEGQNNNDFDTNGLTLEEVSLLELNGGESFDDKGNILNKEGNIVKTKDEVSAIKLSKNDKGELVDGTGKVVKTKEQVDDFEYQLLPIVNQVISRIGVVPFGEDGKPKAYDDTTEGLVEYAMDVIPLQVQASLNKVFERYPDVKDFITHRHNGGTAEDFFINRVQNDYKSWVLDDKNEDNMISIITKDLQVKGHSVADANELAKLIKDSGTDKLKEKAKASLVSLQAYQTQTETAKQAQANAERQANIDDEKTYWREVGTIINKGNLEGVQISEAMKQPFIDYISKPVDKNGNTQADLDAKQETTARGLQIDYLRMMKFDFTKLISNMAKTNQVKTLSEHLKKNAKGTLSGGTRQGLAGKIDLNGLSLKEVQAANKT